ncbi:hypothetical protein RvY_06261 [Ramazzottius varieornatus]|uniref:Uncharacterized protein n=1 Tax=Ramazzottius varieornatus TaxID=947166 RepID=A0A1D1UXX9_RAMVA|nr:hypothetical protein RvY_06261 [Ramazzottius varieornatus]
MNMYLPLALVLVGVVLVQAQPLGFGIPFSQQSNRFSNNFGQQFNNAAGNAAGAGQAQAGGLGSSASINQANHVADRFRTASQGLSANTAQGTMGSQAGGAAQAGGQIQGGQRFQSNMGSQNFFQQG